MPTIPESTLGHYQEYMDVLKEKMCTHIGVLGLSFKICLLMRFSCRGNVCEILACGFLGVVGVL